MFTLVIVIDNRLWSSKVINCVKLLYSYLQYIQILLFILCICLSK